MKKMRKEAEEEAERSTRWPNEIPKARWPNYIYTDMGKGLVGGTIGGSAFYFIKGFRSAGTGSSLALASGMRAARANALRVGGGTTVLFGLNTFVHHYLYYYRQRDDHVNTAVAAAVVGAATVRATRARSFPASCAALCLGAFGSLVHTYYHRLWYDVDKQVSVNKTLLGQSTTTQN